MLLEPPACRRKTTMASSSNVHVRICGQEIVKYDLEIKALIQVKAPARELSTVVFPLALKCACRCGEAV